MFVYVLVGAGVGGGHSKSNDSVVFFLGNKLILVFGIIVTKQKNLAKYTVKCLDSSQLDWKQGNLDRKLNCLIIYLTFMLTLVFFSCRQLNICMTLIHSRAISLARKCLDV